MALPLFLAQGPRLEVPDLSGPPERSSLHRFFPEVFRRPLTPPAPRMADMSSSLGLAADTNLLALSSFFVTEGRLEEAEEDDAEGIGGRGIRGAGGITPPDGVVTLDVLKCGGGGGGGAGEEAPFEAEKEKAPLTFFSFDLPLANSASKAARSPSLSVPLFFEDDDDEVGLAGLRLGRGTLNSAAGEGDAVAAASAANLE